ncbi:retrovirus-related pol polyprotein from transposon TNT 1-94 [Tanacetum coccineum]
MSLPGDLGPGINTVSNVYKTLSSRKGSESTATPTRTPSYEEEVLVCGGLCHGGGDEWCGGGDGGDEWLGVGDGGDERYQVSILEKDKGFGHETHKSEESEAVYGVTPLKDYAVTYSNKEMSHHTLYGIKPLLLYAATFKFTRDDLSESALRGNIGDKGNVGSQNIVSYTMVSSYTSDIVSYTMVSSYTSDIVSYTMVSSYFSDIVSYTMVSFYFSDIMSCTMVSLISQTLGRSLSEIEEHIEEEVTKIMAETMEQYMSKTREDYGSGVTRPTINQDTPFELKGQFLKELHDNTFSGSEQEDANEHIEKVLEIVDLFHIPKVTQDQIMLRAFPVSLTGAASRWLRNQPSGSITTWEVLKTKFLNKYCPPARTAKKMEEINNFQQEPDESLFRAWERFKELLMKCPQHYLTDMQEVILFYNGLDVPTRQILDSKGAIPSKTAAAAKTAIQEMVEYSPEMA